MGGDFFFVSIGPPTFLAGGVLRWVAFAVAGRGVGDVAILGTLIPGRRSGMSDFGVGGLPK